MRAAKQKEKEAKKNKERTKPSFTHPLAIRWPALGTQEAEVVLRRLATHCRGLERQRVHRVPYAQLKQEDGERNRKIQKRDKLSFRSQMMCVGINSVTKALEKGLNFLKGRNVI